MIRRLTRAGCLGSDASFAPHQGPYILGTLGKVTEPLSASASLPVKSE